MCDVNTVAEAIANTLSPDAAQRRAAETFLSQREADTPDLPVLLLRAVASDALPPHVRQSSAVHLKNVTARSYATPTDDSTATGPSNPAAYDQVKSAIVELMLAAPPPIRKPLGVTIATIADADHPARWQALVPDLSKRLHALIPPEGTANLLQTVDWSAMTRIIHALNAVFERYPERMRSNDLYTEINYSLSHSQAYVLSLFNLATRVVNEDASLASAPPAAQNMLSMIHALCKAFYNLSWQDLPEFFEDSLSQFMSALNKLLTLHSDALDALPADGDDDGSPLDRVHCQILEIVNLYITKYDEDVRKYIPQFMADTWQLLMKRGNAVRYDTVVTTGIKLLTSIARSPDYHLFSQPNALSNVCNSIILSNIQIRADDVEVFDDDPVEYIRQDLEGSDTGTRRRSAIELIKGLCVHYEKQVTELFSSFVQSIFTPATPWKDKDTAIYLVIALGWKTGTLMRGVSETSALIDINHFFSSFVKDQLMNAAANPDKLSTDEDEIAAGHISPIFIADLIKFVIAFRHQISVQGCHDVLLACGKLVGCNEQYVIQTYAAACIERLLTMRKDATDTGISKPTTNGTGKPAKKGPSEYRISKDDVTGLLPTILPVILGALKHTNDTQQHSNEYMMRLVLRLATFCRGGLASHAEQVLPTLLAVLTKVTANPSNPLYNHYLFECLAALIRFNATPDNITAFEGALMGPLCNVLVQDVTEFGPYVFQLLAQLLSVRPPAPPTPAAAPPLPSQYADLLAPTLNPAMWERRAYISSMVAYLCAYVLRAPAALVDAGQLEPALGVFQKLIASKATDHHGLALLSTLLEAAPLPALTPLLQQVLNALMLRLASAKTAKYVTHLLCALAVLVLRPGAGAPALRDAADAVQPGLLLMVLRQVWLPDAPKLRDVAQRALVALALSRLLALGTHPPYTEVWPEMVDVNVALAEGILLEAGDDDDDDDDGADAPGVLVGAAETYNAAQSALRWGLPQPAKAIAERAVAGKNVRKEVLASVAAMVDGAKDTFEPLLKTRVSPEARAALSKYESSANA